MILAGDVGGTKVDLALCKFDNGQLLTGESAWSTMSSRCGPKPERW